MSIVAFFSVSLFTGNALNRDRKVRLFEGGLLVGLRVLRDACGCLLIHRAI